MIQRQLKLKLTKVQELTLSVRQWTCTVCGTDHDRDCNAAKNTLIAGAGVALESSAA